VLLEIRARLSLEVAKFKANAKVAGASFKTIATAAKVSTDKLDAVISKSANDRLAQSKVNDQKQIQSTRERNKKLSKIEAEKYRNKGGTAPGTNGGGREADAQKRVAIEAAAGAKILANSKKNSARQNALTAKESDYQARASKNYIASKKVQASRTAAMARKTTNKTVAFERAAANKTIKLNKKVTRARVKGEKEALAKVKMLRSKVRANKTQKQGRDHVRGTEFESQAPRIRYAMYDIGRRALVAGAAIAGVGVAAVAMAAKFESAFTSVERTTSLAGAQLENLRKQLIEISTTIPVAFEEVAAIATLGAQMGIASDSLDEFTTTVARFSAITGITAEETAQSFGRLAQLMKVPVTEFENLSSAITYAGIRAVATDAEILKMSESIAASASNVGFAADEVIGYATAMASLKVRSAEARGVMIRTFRNIDLAVSQGGQRLQDFSRVLGVTTEEARSLWKQDPSKFFATFLEGANAAGNLNEVMQDLGIVNVRELNVIQRLAGNMDVLTAALKDTREQFLLGTYASEAYAKKADDFASKVQVMTQTLQALIASVGAPIAEALKPLIDFFTEMLNTFKSVDPIASTIVVVMAAVVGGFLLFKGALALAIAGLLALKTGLGGLQSELGGLGLNMRSAALIAKNLGVSVSGAGAAAGVASLKFAKTGVALTGMGASARTATFAMRALAFASGPIGIGLMAILAIAPSVMNAVSKTGDAAEKAGASMFQAAGGAEVLLNAVAQDTQDGGRFYRSIKTGVEALTESQIDAKNAIYDTAIANATAQTSITGNSEELDDLVEIQKDFNEQLKVSNDGLVTNTALLGDNTAAALLNGLSKYGDDGEDFWMQMASLSPASESALELLGFNAAEMITAGLEEDGGAEAYADKISGFLRVLDLNVGADAAFAPDVFKDLQGVGFEGTIKEVEELIDAYVESNGEIGEFIDKSIDAGTATDGSARKIIQSVKAAEIQGKAMDAAADSTDGTTEATESLSDALRRYAKESSGVQDNSIDLYGSFTKLAGVFEGVTGELDILTEDGRKAMSAWSTFMQDAIDNAVANDTNFVGSVGTMAAAIFALGQEGVNTGYQFETMREYIVRNMAATVPALAGFATSLSSAMDTTELLKMIDAQILLANTLYLNARLMGGDGAGNQAGALEELKYLKALRDSLGDSAGTAADFGAIWKDAMEGVSESTGKAIPPLEKLLSLIEDVFKYKNLYANIYESLNSLGESLRENGKDFSIYTDEGRSNLGALEDTIQAFSEKSGGNMDKFANDLASLRAALVRSGAPAAALKIIDDTLAKIGKTGQASAHATGQFAEAIQNAGEQVRGLYKIKDAMDDIASGLKKAFDATFAAEDAVDSVTLGWLDMAEAAEDARESISDAGKDIADARIEIEKLDAEISGLAADKGKLQYQLSIALKYGDTLRANEIRAEIATLNADVVAKESAIADAENGIRDSVEQIATANGILGNSAGTRQQIERNQAIRDMALRYGDVAASMIANAKPGTDLNKIINDQVAAFESSAIQMGYSKTEASAMADTLRDELIYQMNQLPEEVTTDIKADTTYATRAINDFVNFANGRLAQVRDKTVVINTMHTSSVAPPTVSYNPTTPSYGGGGGKLVRRAAGGYISGPGSSSSDSIAAMLSNGEYVVRASAVSKYGVDFFNSLNQMKTAPAGASSAVSQQSGGNGMVYLSPEDRQLLRAAIDRPISLYTDSTVIASSANKGNQILAQRGIK
jgi:TP901 family phage tail tape measure protein